MLFGKKHTVPHEKETESFFRYRDSLTGLFNREFAFKEYEKVKNIGGYTVVTIRVSGCDSMPYYKACRYIKRAGELAQRMCEENVARIESGDFILFCKNGEEVCKRLIFFLGRLSFGDEVYTAVCDELDKNESFEKLVQRIQRHTGAEELNNMMQML